MRFAYRKSSDKLLEFTLLSELGKYNKIRIRNDSMINDRTCSNFLIFYARHEILLRRWGYNNLQREANTNNIDSRI